MFRYLTISCGNNLFIDQHDTATVWFTHTVVTTGVEFNCVAAMQDAMMSYI